MNGIDRCDNMNGAKNVEMNDGEWFWMLEGRGDGEEEADDDDDAEKEQEMEEGTNDFIAWIRVVWILLFELCVGLEEVFFCCFLRFFEYVTNGMPCLDCDAAMNEQERVTMDGMGTNNKYYYYSLE